MVNNSRLEAKIDDAVMPLLALDWMVSTKNFYRSSVSCLVASLVQIVRTVWHESTQARGKVRAQKVDGGFWEKKTSIQKE